RCACLGQSTRGRADGCGLRRQQRASHSHRRTRIALCRRRFVLDERVAAGCRAVAAQTLYARPWTADQAAAARRRTPTGLGEATGSRPVEEGLAQLDLEGGD